MMKSFLQAKLAQLRHLRQDLLGDVVLQNSLFLMASTAVMGVFGFGFWLISARLYSPEEIGLASTLIASATTLSLFSLLGFDNVLVRFLPGSKRPDRVIDTSLIFTGIASIVLSVAFLLALPVISPSLMGILESPLHALFFVFTLLLVTINTLTDSVFVAWQKAKYILIADTGLSIVKVVLPMLLVAFGAFGIFTGYAAATTVAATISLAVLAKRYRYVFRPLVHRQTIQEVRRFSAGTYAANLAAAVPLMVLPIMATNVLGPKTAAFFNLAMTIATLLFIIPRATSESLFAAGAKDGRAFNSQFRRTIRQTMMLLVPAILGIFILGPYVLAAFGAQYAEGSLTMLRILAFSALPLAFNLIAAIVVKLHHKLWQLITVQVIGTVLMLALAWPLMARFGAAGVAWAWLIGQAVTALMLALATLPLLQHDNLLAGGRS